MNQDLIELLQELEYLSRSGSHTFILSLVHKDMDLDMWKRLQGLLKEINTKSQEAFLLTASLRRES